MAYYSINKLFNKSLFIYKENKFLFFGNLNVNFNSKNKETSANPGPFF